MLQKSPFSTHIRRCKRMKKRWNINQIKEFVEKNSESTLLSTEYHGFSQKLLFKCECGNNFEKTFTKFKNRHQRKCDVCQPPKESR